MALEEVRKIRRVSEAESSLNAPAAPDSPHSTSREEAGNLLADESAREDAEAALLPDWRSDLAHALLSLPDSERRVLCMRFGLADPTERNPERGLKENPELERRPMTLREVGEELGLSQERVRQVQLGR